MKTTIEIETEDTHAISNLMDMISGYLDKKKIPFLCIGYIKCDNGKKFSMVMTDGLKK